MVRWSCAFFVIFVCAAAHGAEAAGPPTPTPTTPAARAGFLSAGQLPDAVLILAPPPKPGSATESADETVVKATRSLEGSPRWALAAHDAVNYIGAFDCALGLTITHDATPKTVQLLSRVGADASRVIDAAKDHFARPRPFVGTSLPICVENQRSGLAKSFSYPSGHSTFSWASGLILAEMEPDKAGVILARARAFGESRVVCGVHYPSDVEAGRTTGAALVAALHANPEFQAAFAAAKAELVAAEAAPHPAPPVKTCAVDEDAEIHTPWANPDTAK